MINNQMLQYFISQNPILQQAFQMRNDAKSLEQLVRMVARQKGVSDEQLNSMLLMLKGRN